MASFDEVQLWREAFTSGAVLRLRRPALVSAVHQDADVEIEVVAGKPFVLVRNLDAVNYEECFSRSLDDANKGLDLLCARGAASEVLAGGRGDSILWWRRPDGRTVLRVWFTAPVGARIGPILLNVSSPDGSSMPAPGAPPLQWHESLRYFRLAQTADDSLEAFRCMYLALESILSRICPPTRGPSGRQSEREGDWFKRALAVADNMVGLEAYALPGAVDPVQALFEELYLHVRNRVFHAKEGRSALLPLSEPSKQPVLSMLLRLGQLYSRLVEATLHIRFSRARLSESVFSAMTDAMFDFESLLAVDSVPLDLSTTRLPESTRASSLQHRRTDASETPNAQGILATQSDAQLMQGAVRGIVAVNAEGIILFAGDLEGDLDLTGLDEFETVFAPRYVNFQELREHYST